MAYDSPKLGTYTLQAPPDTMDVRWEIIQQMNELADGGFRQRILGYRLRAELTWDTNWMRSQDLTGLMGIANDTTGAAGTGLGAITFTPRPATYPTRTFSVIWENKFDFGYNNGKFGLYGGSISLVSPTPTATITDLP